MQHASPPLAVRPAEAARLLALPRTRLFAELAAGRLPSAKVGRARLIPVEEIRAWLDRQLGGQPDGG